MPAAAVTSAQGAHTYVVDLKGLTVGCLPHAFDLSSGSSGFFSGLPRIRPKGSEVPINGDLIFPPVIPHGLVDHGGIAAHGDKSECTSLSQ